MNTNNRAILDKANTALEEGRLEDFLALCTPDVRMSWPGTDQVWTGHDAIRANMGPMMALCPQMKINVIEKIVEGDNAVGHGTMKMKGPDGSEQPLWFSDVYRFSEGKIAEITSYMVGFDKRHGTASPDASAIPALRNHTALENGSTPSPASHKETIIAVNRAFESGSVEDFLALCTPDVSWTMAGMGSWDGADTIREMWHGMMTGASLPRISVRNMIVEGSSAMGDGVVECTRADGSKQTMHYSDVYRFEGDKIAALTSYCVEEKPAHAAQHAEAELEAA
jgi:ketosteroid isomerase-like protein